MAKRLGRPTAYKPEYCEMVVAHMRNGMSIASFAAAVGVSRETIWKWGKAYPEFRNACGVAKETSQVWWEKLAIAIATGQHKELKDSDGNKRFENANAGMVMFLMARRFPDYHDKSHMMTGAGPGDEFEDEDEDSDDDDESLNAQLAKELERVNARNERKKKKEKTAGEG